MGHPGSARQPQQMAQGRMMDDKQMGRGRMMMDDKKTPDSAPMQDQGKMGQQGDAGGMWMRTERMMRGQMGGMPGMGAASGTVRRDRADGGTDRLPEGGASDYR